MKLLRGLLRVWDSGGRPAYRAKVAPKTKIESNFMIFLPHVLISATNFLKYFKKIWKKHDFFQQIHEIRYFIFSIKQRI